jgi:hypothetical protein
VKVRRKKTIDADVDDESDADIEASGSIEGVGICEVSYM